MRPSLVAVAVAVGSVVALGWAGDARAQATCTNDTDCTANGTACGTDVCSWKGAHHCVAVTSADPGWCSGDTTCKCQGEGATCVGTYCTFTTPRDAGGSSGVAASGAASGSGASGAASGTAYGSGSVSSTGASASGRASAGSAPEFDGGSVATTSGGSAGGCDVGRGGRAPLAFGGLALGGLLALVRRRRRTATGR